MVLISQDQQTVFAITSYLINLLSITANVYYKTLKLKAYSGTFKKHLSNISDYTAVEFLHPPMLCATHKYCPYQQVESNSLQIVHSYASRLSTCAHP